MHPAENQIRQANEAAKDCPNHRMTLIGSEIKYKTKGNYDDPIAHVYIYRCSGDCRSIIEYTSTKFDAYSPNQVKRK